MSAGKDDNVFLDAKEEITPRRSGRKRRSTAGSTLTPAEPKKARPTKRMPTHRSPGRPVGNNPKADRRQTAPSPPAPAGAADDPDAFWARMGGLLSGMETRLKQETTDVKDQLGQAIGDLGNRVERTERRLDEVTGEVHRIVDMRLANLSGLTHPVDAGDPVMPVPWDVSPMRRPCPRR